MEEKLVPGDYTALIDLKIRKQMDTQSMTNQVGVYMRGVPFVVWEVYPEKNGIVWGRVSSNTGDGEARYVGLRVANQMKAHLEKVFDNNQNNNDSLVAALKDLTAAVWALVRK